LRDLAPARGLLPTATSMREFARIACHRSGPIPLSAANNIGQNSLDFVGFNLAGLSARQRFSEKKIRDRGFLRPHLISETGEPND
jgi:hypothetical protein